MSSQAEVHQENGIVFLLDVDNTLLDNDKLKSDISDNLERLVGPERAHRFWQLYEQVREEEDYVDYPTTVERMEKEYNDPALGRQLNDLLDRIAFKSYLYPHVLDTIAYLETLGTVTILSDGDSVFQPRKIRESGLEEAVHGNVMVYVHKEQELKHVFARYAARHYVAVDDKPRIVSALERDCPEKFTTILILQGKYARQGELEPKPDYVLPHIGDLRHFTREQFLAPGEARAAAG